MAPLTAHSSLLIAHNSLLIAHNSLLPLISPLKYPASMSVCQPFRFSRHYASEVFVMKRLLTIPLFFLLIAVTLRAQVPGVPPSVPDLPESVPAEDSTYIFKPARPLIDSNALRTKLDNAFGLNVLFSNSGYGLGFFYEHKLASTLSAFIDLGISGARKGDEFEVYNTDPNSVHFRTYYVPNKIHRVWHVPLTVGLKKGVFTDVFFNNFRPFINAGAGGSIVMTTPYDQTFFSAFGDAEFHLAPGGFIGIGAEFTEKSPGPAFNARYYYLPITPGVESLIDEPINDFGGLYLMLNVPL